MKYSIFVPNNGVLTRLQMGKNKVLDKLSPIMGGILWLSSGACSSWPSNSIIFDTVDDAKKYITMNSFLCGENVQVREHSPSFPIFGKVVFEV